MGVFLYSNKVLKTEKIEDVFKSRGHKNIVTRVNNNATLLSAPKIIVQNENYVDGSELGGVKEDFALGIGTYFYKGKYGKDALIEVYKNLEEILEENPVYGHWAFCIHKNGATYIFNDMSGFMRLYKYESNDEIVISSSHTAVISTITNPKVDKARLAGLVAGGYAREEGFVQDLVLMDPLKYLVIEDGKAPKWVNKTIPEVKRIETLDEAVSYVYNLFQEQMSVIKTAIKEKYIYIDATGGLDSRLIASNLNTAGFNYDFINYPIFGPDAEIAKILSEGMNKKLHVQTNKPIGEDYKNHVGEFDFGNNFFRQYPNPRWTLENDFEFSGARGECIDLPDIYSDEDVSFMKDPRISVLLPHLSLNPIMTDKVKKEYAEYLMSYIEERTGISRDKKMSEYEQVKFCQFTAGQHGDSNYNSGAQAHCYFYSLYNEWHFNHFISDIAFDAKSCRKLTIALIKKISPELAKFPFVSRRRTKRNSVNEVTELPAQYFSYNGIKNLLPKSVVSFLYGRMGRQFSKERMEAIHIDRYGNIFDINELKSHRNLYSDILNRLYSVDAVIDAFGIEI